MSTPTDRLRPEAGADTRQGRHGEGSKEHRGDSGGHRTPAGSTYGDYVPDRGQPHRNDDIDQDPVIQENFDIARPPEDPQAAQEEERVAEANRNKGFDTPHIHSSATTRKL